MLILGLISKLSMNHLPAVIAVCLMVLIQVRARLGDAALVAAARRPRRRCSRC
jgi:hypothetical protein